MKDARFNATLLAQQLAFISQSYQQSESQLFSDRPHGGLRGLQWTPIIACCNVALQLCADLGDANSESEAQDFSASLESLRQLLALLQCCSHLSFDFRSSLLPKLLQSFHIFKSASVENIDDILTEMEQCCERYVTYFDSGLNADDSFEHCMGLLDSICSEVCFLLE